MFLVRIEKIIEKNCVFIEADMFTVSFRKKKFRKKIPVHECGDV
jgi:hypothetical protein